MSAQVPTWQIDEIMLEFEWQRVHRAMVALHWTYQDRGAVPTIAELKSAVRELLALLDRPGQSISAGGFQVTWEKRGGLRVEFILESWVAE